MGSGPSYEREYRDAERQAGERKAEAERYRKEAEERKKEAEERRKEAAEMKVKIQAAIEENERIRSKAQEVADENNRIRVEKDRIQAESYEKEKEQLEEKYKMKEENLKLQEQIKLEKEIRRLEEKTKKITDDAKERVQNEVYLREEAERNLEKGIPPVKYPTREDFEEIRRRLQYQDGSVHVAITGAAGGGKSSLINAFRGLPNSNSNINLNIAKTGTSETTSEIGRYCDPARPWLIWYDIPGAGTMKIPSWQYFNDQGLYIFDIIIIVIDSRFTRIDVDLLYNCKRFGIPAFVVRSKANQHIMNIMRDDDYEGGETPEQRLARASTKFVTETCQEFKTILQDTRLPPQKIYMVSKDILWRFIKGTKTSVEITGTDPIDELELAKDVINAADEKRSYISPE